VWWRSTQNPIAPAKHRKKTASDTRRCGRVAVSYAHGAHAGRSLSVKRKHVSQSGRLQLAQRTSAGVVG
jgi:hypothetical protein